MCASGSYETSVVALEFTFHSLTTNINESRFRDICMGYVCSVARFSHIRTGADRNVALCQAREDDMFARVFVTTSRSARG